MSALEFERPEAGVAIVRLNRPHVRNAVDREVMDRLEHLLDEIEGDASLQALILTGTGSSFCAGGDMDYFATLDSRDKAIAMSARMQSLLHRLWAGQRVTIASVNGAAAGGGCELLTACHVRIASESATLRFVHAKHGLLPGWGGTGRLIAMLGRDRAQHLMLNAAELSAHEALQAGLIHEIAPAERELDAALAFARSIAAIPTSSVRGILSIVAASDADMAVRLNDIERERFGDCWAAAEIWRKFGARKG